MFAALVSLLIILSPFAHARTLAQPDPVGEPQRRLKSLTHYFHTPQSDDFGDPSPPDFSTPGQVQVLTTNGEVLTWKDSDHETATQRFLCGDRPSRELLPTYDTDGKTFLEAWDPTIETFPEFGGEKILYAGVTTAPEGLKEARWPEDDWRRRVQAFKFNEKSKRWIRIADSVQGDPPDRPTWIGHSYGHQIIRDEQGKVWFFYEKVTSDLHGQPWATEIYAQEMISPTLLADDEIPILEFQRHIWPAARRYSGGALVEGARPFKFGDDYLIGFSAGEYTSDDYGIHLLWSQNITGPYLPILSSNKKDLKNFSEDLEDVFDMTWGAARPAFFEVDGQWWVLFHGILKSDVERIDTEERDVFLAPVNIRPNSSGPPDVRISF